MLVDVLGEEIAERLQIGSISTLLWDIGGTIFSEAQLSYEGDYDRVLELLGLSGERADEIFARFWPHGLYEGKIGEDVYWRALIEESPNKPPLGRVKSLYRESIKCNEEVLRLVEELSGSIDQYVASNHAREWMEYERQHWHLDRYFQGFYGSYNLGILKPAPKFFLQVLGKSGERPDEVLYIDNSPKNIDVAGSLGIHTLLYRWVR